MLEAAAWSVPPTPPGWQLRSTAAAQLARAGRQPAQLQMGQEGSNAHRGLGCGFQTAFAKRLECLKPPRLGFGGRDPAA